MKILRVIKWRMDELFFASARLLFRQRKGGGVILLVRTDGIGDFVFFSRYLSSLRKAFVGHKLALVCRTETAELAGKIHALDAVIGFRSLAYRWNYLYRLYVLLTIRSLRPDVAIYCTYHRMHVGDEMTLLSGAGRTIAMSGNDESIHPGVRLKNNQRYGHVVEVPKSAHEGDRYSRLFTACGVGDLTAVDVLQEAVVQWKRSGRGAENTYDVVIVPGGSAEIRRWPTGRFRELVHRLRSSGIRQIAVCGSRDEYSLLESISAGLPDDVALLCGRPLMEIAATVQSASLIVGNENGILHLAAALRRPTVVIQGGGHFGRYFPNEAVRVVHHPLDCFGCNWRCPFPEAYCLTRISVDDVMTAFTQSWERRGKTA